ncbi:hypothetical protein PSP6_510006 [Paraburkholderia tropica]|nr:hypothetical protein PSP6_510006 [Paraburkholderia tropica]
MPGKGREAINNFILRALQDLYSESFLTSERAPLNDCRPGCAILTSAVARPVYAEICPLKMRTA